MNARALFDRRWRGFRVVDLLAVGCLFALVLGVYAFKAGAGRESAQIADVDHQIADERRQVRLLKAELAHLQSPARLERLSTAYLGLQPLPAGREAPLESLGELAHVQTPAPPVLVPAVAPVSPAR
jgi:hypothetical protein